MPEAIEKIPEEDAAAVLRDGYSKALNAWALNPVPCMALDVAGKILLDVVRELYPGLGEGEHVVDVGLYDQEAKFDINSMEYFSQYVGACDDVFNDLFHSDFMVDLQLTVAHAMAEAENSKTEDRPFDLTANSMRVSITHRGDTTYDVNLHYIIKYQEV